MATELPSSVKVPPYMAFFLVHGMQVGVGILGFSRYIADVAGYRAWIAVLLAGAINQLIIWMAFRIISKAESGDLYGMAKQALGKWGGGLVVFLFVFYFAMLAVVVLRTYIEVIQVWIYPGLMTWSMALIVLLVEYYAIVKGFRVVAGLNFIFVLIPTLLWPTVLPVLEFAEWYHLTPLFDTTWKKQIEAAFLLTLSFSGAELLLVYAPFLKKGKGLQLSAHLGSACTTLVYLLVVFVTFLYYSHEQLTLTIWPTLSAWKVVSLVFIERIEYLCIAIWLTVIFPNIALAIWASSRLLKQQLGVRHRTTAKVVVFLVFIATIQFDTRRAINALNDGMNYVGPLFIFGLLPLLWAVSLFLKKKGDASHV